MTHGVGAIAGYALAVRGAFSIFLTSHERHGDPGVANLPCLAIDQKGLLDVGIVRPVVGVAFEVEWVRQVLGSTGDCSTDDSLCRGRCVGHWVDGYGTGTGTAAPGDILVAHQVAGAGDSGDVVTGFTS